jgi:hypothetical protein
MLVRQQQQQQQRVFPAADLVVWLLVVGGAALHVVQAGPAAVSAAGSSSKLFFKDDGSAANGETTVIRVAAGHNVVLECEAGGSPSPTVHWLRNGQRIHQGNSDSWDDDAAEFETISTVAVGSSLKLSLTRSRLFVDCLTPSTAGEYVCIAETPIRRISKQFYIELDEAVSNDVRAIGCIKRNARGDGAARVYMWTSHRIELEGVDVQLFCRADGVQAVTWYDRDDNVITNDSPQYKILDNGDLVVRKVSWRSNMGLYRCVAGNSQGSDTIHVFLYPTKAK